MVIKYHDKIKKIITKNILIVTKFSDKIKFIITSYLLK